MNTTLDRQLIVGILTCLCAALVMSRLDGVWHVVAAVMLGIGIVLTVNSVRLRAKGKGEA